MVCAFDALGVEGYYTDRMLLLRADMQVLQAFMKVKCPKVAKVGGGAWGGGWGLVGGPCLSKNRVPSHGIVSIFLTEEVIWIDLGAAYPIFRHKPIGSLLDSFTHVVYFTMNIANKIPADPFSLIV